MFTKSKKYQHFILFGPCLLAYLPSQQPLPSHRNRGFLPSGVPMIGAVLSTD